MKLRRIGDKIISEDKLAASVRNILDFREGGATQIEAAERFGVQRSFVSFLETLGEVRRGRRVALLAFPVSNVGELALLGERYSLEKVLALSSHQGDMLIHDDADELFNLSMSTLEELVDYDVVVICASDRNIASFQHVLPGDVVGFELGTAPLREPVPAPIDDLDRFFSELFGEA